MQQSASKPARGVGRLVAVAAAATAVFSTGETPALIAYDVIEQLPDTGSLTVRRITLSEAFGELELTPTPTVTATPPASVSPELVPPPGFTP
ncbi:MAG: hypothetical protein L0206_12135 [Actinobacteria bacterium]|nr:hypothetical protein [Actinomycetota bacterium]